MEMLELQPEIVNWTSIKQKLERQKLKMEMKVNAVMENLEISKEDIRSGERKWRPQCKT